MDKFKDLNDRFVSLGNGMTQRHKFRGDVLYSIRIDRYLLPRQLTLFAVFLLRLLAPFFYLIS